MSAPDENKSTLLVETLFVALGGGLGTLSRQGLNISLFWEPFPLSTVVENLSGAFLLGLLVAYLATHARSPVWMRSGIGVGFLGGFTTMSTFAADFILVALYQDLGLGLIYIALSLVGGLVMASGGLRLGQSLFERRDI